MHGPIESRFADVDKQIIAQMITAVSKDMPEMNADTKKMFDVVMEFVAEALHKATEELKIPARWFQLKVSADVDGFVQYAKFRVTGERSFIVLLSLNRLLSTLELMRQSPFRRPEYVKSLLVDVGHEMYHGFQLINAKDQLTGIPLPDDDFEKYWTSQGEQMAEAYGHSLSEYIASQPNFSGRLL